MKRAFIGFLMVAGVIASPAHANQAEDVLLAIEASRNAQTTSQRWRAALELETLAHEDAPGAASALASLILDGAIAGTESGAREWAKRGHALGEPDATFLLARMWAEGTGGEKDLGRAAELARQASMAGLPAASVFVYELLIDTDETNSAMAHLMLAAEAGYPKAQHLLGIHLAAGRNIDQDYSEAYFWLVLADAHGAVDAERLVASVGSQLSVERRQELIRTALEWRPR